MAASARTRKLLNRDAVVGVVVAVACLILLWLWAWRGPFVGLADNGDWERYLCPAGLAAQPADLYFEAVPDQLVPAERCRWYYRSSQVIVLASARVVNGAFGGGSLPVRGLAVGLGLAGSVFWGLAAWQLSRTTKRPLVAAGAGIGAAVVFADVTFSSYLGSVYAEAFVFAATPLVVALLIRVVRAHAPGWVWALVVVTTLGVTTAKSQLAPFALVVFAVAAIGLRGDRWQSGRAAAAAALVLAVTVFDLTVFAEGTYDEANHANFVFTGVLVEVDDPETVLRDLGLSPAAAAELSGYVGASYWGPQGTTPGAAAYGDFVDSVTRGKIAGYLVNHPVIAWRMGERAVHALPDSRVDFLGNFFDPADGMLADRPEPVTSLLRPVVDLWWLLLPIGWVAVAAGGAWRLWRDPDPALAVAVFLAMAAAATTALSVGDGYVDLERHAVIGAWFTGVLVFGALGAAAGLAADRIAGR